MEIKQPLIENTYNEEEKSTKPNTLKQGNK